MRRALRALLPLLLWACGPSPLPAPVIESVEPPRVPEGVASVLSVKVKAVLPLSVDYQEQSAKPETLALTVRLAGQAVDIPFAHRDGTLVVRVPESLPLGGHDIRVTLADGREAVREGAFSVVPPATLIAPGDDESPEADGGLGAEGSPEDRRRFFGFWIEPPGDQRRNVPFTITLRALGQGAKTFNEAITLRASKGQVLTHRQGTFSEGVRVETISLSDAGSNIYLLVEDARGHLGLSPPFAVR